MQEQLKAEMQSLVESFRFAELREWVDRQPDDFTARQGKPTECLLAKYFMGRPKSRWFECSILDGMLFATDWVSYEIILLTQLLTDFYCDFDLIDLSHARNADEHFKTIGKARLLSFLEPYVEVEALRYATT